MPFSITVRSKSEQEQGRVIHISLEHHRGRFANLYLLTGLNHEWSMQLAISIRPERLEYDFSGALEVETSV
jgi:hypothetical protein